MNVATIDRTIRALCPLIEQTDHDTPAWHQVPESHLLREACTCVFSSQMLFEVAEAAADRIYDERLLAHAETSPVRSAHERLLRTALSTPLTVSVNDRLRRVRPRFPNRMAHLWATTAATLRNRRQSLHALLRGSRSPRDARRRLVPIVCGFGPKQASLFLRRVGYSAQLAVLDVHILDYLRAARHVRVNSNAISSLPGYELIEDEFRRFANEFGQPVGRVDVATWITVRVAKREALW